MVQKLQFVVNRGLTFFSKLFFLGLCGFSLHGHDVLQRSISHIFQLVITYTASITYECLKIGIQSCQAQFTFVCIDHTQLLRTTLF